METPQDWYFTFGVGNPNKQKFVKINGTFKSARDEMYRRFGTKWAFQYASMEEAGVKEHNLVELP